MSELDAVFLHIIHLSRLSARGGRGYIAVKEAHKAVFYTSQQRYLYFEHPEHILDYHRFSRNEEKAEHNAEQQPELIGFIKISYDR